MNPATQCDTRYQVIKSIALCLLEPFNNTTLVTGWRSLLPFLPENWYSIHVAFIWSFNLLVRRFGRHRPLLHTNHEGRA